MQTRDLQSAPKLVFVDDLPFCDRISEGRPGQCLNQKRHDQDRGDPFFHWSLSFVGLNVGL